MKADTSHPLIMSILIRDLDTDEIVKYAKSCDEEKGECEVFKINENGDMEMDGNGSFATEIKKGRFLMYVTKDGIGGIEQRPSLMTKAFWWSQMNTLDVWVKRITTGV